MTVYRNCVATANLEFLGFVKEPLLSTAQAARHLLSTPCELEDELACLYDNRVENEVPLLHVVVSPTCRIGGN